MISRELEQWNLPHSILLYSMKLSGLDKPTTVSDIQLE